jgi:SPP1 gp7 family putative phage head morphogenesis protein
MQELIERVLFLQHVGNTISRSLREALAELFFGFERDLRRADPTGVQARYRAARREAFMARTRERVRRWLPPTTEGLRDALTGLGRQQAVAVHDDLIATLGTFDLEGRVRETPVTRARMRAILSTEPFEGRVLKDHGTRLGANIVDRVGVQVRLGMAREEPIDDIVRRIRGRRVAGSRAFAGGVMQTTTRDAEAIVRTAVTYTAARGMLETFRENATILEGVQYLATLDDRVTLLCFSLDGTVWELDDPGIVIPGEATHWNCRSTLVGRPDWAKLGLTPPPEPDRIARDLSTVSDDELERTVRARRRSGGFGDVERIPTNVTATEWLRRQRPSVQNKMLGKGRAEMFRRGEVGLKDLVTKDFRTVSLAELSVN